MSNRGSKGNKPNAVTEVYQKRNYTPLLSRKWRLSIEDMSSYPKTLKRIDNQHYSNVSLSFGGFQFLIVVCFAREIVNCLAGASLLITDPPAI